MSSCGLSVSERIVIATIAVVGFHRWEGALPAVKYLAGTHRHLFTIRAEFGVSHDDRDVEFHIAQGWLRDALVRVWGTPSGVCDFGAMSCEMIAERINLALWNGPGQRCASALEVWEDGENGARVCFAEVG